MLEGRYAPQALSLLRIAASLIFLLHGSSKLLGFPASEMGMPPVGSLMWIGGVLELVGGLLLLIGLFSRPVLSFSIAETMRNGPRRLRRAQISKPFHARSAQPRPR